MTRSLDKCAWLRADEIYAMYPAKIAEALIKEVGANSATNKAHPQMPKCEEARLYYVMTQMTVETETVLTHEQELKAMMNVEDGDDEGASALCDQVTHGIPEPLALQDAPASLPGVMPSPPAVSPAGRPGGHVGSDAGAPSLEEEEAKKEEAEQNKIEEEATKEEAERNKKEADEQKKREAKQAALDKKNSPMTKASEYLKGLAGDITECQRLEKQAETSPTLREILKAEYAKIFVDHGAKLKEQRLLIENALAAENVTLAQITAAHSKITDFHTDKEAFRKSADAYAKAAEPKTQAKAKAGGRKATAAEK